MFNYCTLFQIWTFSKALFKSCKKLFIQIICQVKLNFALEIFIFTFLQGNRSKDIK